MTARRSCSFSALTREMRSSASVSAAASGESAMPVGYHGSARGNQRSSSLTTRRFNRARYDADLTVAAFAARLKDAVELDAVRADLTGVVQATLEPAHVRLWL